MRNYPFIYEKRGETVQKVISKWLFNKVEETKESSEGDLKTIIRQYTQKVNGFQDNSAKHGDPIPLITAQL